MEEITISERKERSSYITYLYNVLSEGLLTSGGSGDLLFGEERTALMIRVPDSSEAIREFTVEKIAEIIGIGYKYEFLRNRLNVCLGRREKKLLCAALIAADYEGDTNYIRRKIGRKKEYTVDGIFHFRLTALQEKWEKIASYVPDGQTPFGSNDRKRRRLRSYRRLGRSRTHSEFRERGTELYGDRFRER